MDRSVIGNAIRACAEHTNRRANEVRNLFRAVVTGSPEALDDALPAVIAWAGRIEDDAALTAIAKQPQGKTPNSAGWATVRGSAHAPPATTATWRTVSRSRHRVRERPMAASHPHMRPDGIPFRDLTPAQQEGAGGRFLDAGPKDGRVHSRDRAGRILSRRPGGGVPRRNADAGA